MGVLTETDYSELIGYLIKHLQEYRATDIIRQIKELETVNVIEEATPAAPQKEPDSIEQVSIWEHGDSRQSQACVKPQSKAAKKQNREAVSEYHSRPMNCEEIFYAAIDILEAYLVSVPQIIEKMERGLQLDSRSKIVWENETVRSVLAEEPVNVISAVEEITPEKQAEIRQSIQVLKRVSGKESV